MPGTVPYGVNLIAWNTLPTTAVDASVDIREIGKATLVAGTVTITPKYVPSSATGYVVLLQPTLTANTLAVTAQTATTFTVTSSAGGDVQTFRYIIVGATTP